MLLTPGRRIDVRLAPLPRNIISRLVLRFRASFSCQLDGDRLRVTRAISFDFMPPLRWFVEPILRRTLPHSIERELRLTRTILEGGASPSERVHT